MTTSLAAQLRQLAVPSTNVYKNDKKRLSLLFDPKEAASISANVVYEIGLEGLEQLIVKNEDFVQFKYSLFQESSKDFDRNIHTKEENKVINKAVKKFLVMLAPYILMNPAHKALEWLYYRYSVYEHNRDDLIMAAIAYYNSNIFTRIIQTLQFNEVGDHFYFLKTVQKSNMHLRSLDLFYQAHSNPHIIKLFTKFMNQLMNAHKNPNTLMVHFNFFCSLFSGAIEYANEVTEGFISEILPLLLNGLSSQVPDFGAASYVITARLLSKTSIKEKLLDTIVEKVSDLKNSSLKLEATLTIVLTYQLQKQYNNLPGTALANFATSGWLIECLNYLHSNGNYIYPFLRVLVQESVHMGVNEDQHTYREVVSSIVNAIELDGSFINIFLGILLESCTEKSSSDPDIGTWLQNIVKELQTKYSSALDLVVSEILKDKNCTGRKKAFLRSLFKSVNESYSTKFKLLIDLYEDQNSLSIATAADSIKKLESGDQYLISNVLLEKLRDHNPRIVERTLELLTQTGVGDAKLVQSNLMDIFKNGKMLDQKWSKSYRLAAELLIQNHSEFNWEIFICLFPYVILGSKSEEVRALLRSKLFAHLFSGSTNIEEIFSSFERNFTVASFEEFLDCVSSQPEMGCLHLFSALIILAQLCPDMSSLSPASISKVFKIFSACQEKNMSSEEASDFQGYLSLALKKRLPLNGAIDCLGKVIGKALKDKTVNWAKVDLREKYSCFIVELCSLAFNSRKLQKAFDLFLNAVSGEESVCQNVALNICASHLLEDSLICKILTFIRSKGVGKLDTCASLHLLALCGHQDPKVRTTAFEVLEASTVESQFAWFLKQLLMYKDEIIVDHDQVPLICFNVLTSSDAEGAAALADLIKMACSKEAPIYAKTAILKVTAHINNFEIFEALCRHFLDYFQTHSYEPFVLTNLIGRLDLHVISKISLDSPIWRFIAFVLTCKGSADLNGENTFLPSFLLNHFSRDVYAAFPEEVLEKLLDLVCEVAAASENPDFICASSKMFKHMDLNAHLVSNLLKQMAEVHSNRSGGRNKRFHSGPTVDILDTLAWKKGVCVLEFIQGKKKIRKGHCLLALLFDILKKCLDFEEQAAVEYPKQLVLSLILLVCNKLEGYDEILEKDFNIELVIQCIRASQNPQTHYHALLALAHAANFVPNEVLHHVMAVFTFMGSTLVRHDDAYSFEVISKIVDTIVPILVTGNHTTTIADVLRVFVDAMLDVPEHRRIPLYIKVLENVKVKENFHVFLLLVLEADVFQSSREKRKMEKGETSQRIKIASTLCQEFSPEITLHACVLLAKYVNQLPDEKDDLTANQSHTINLTNYNAKQFRHYKYLIITFLSGLLSSRSFVNKVSLLSDEDSVNMEPLYKGIIIDVLSYIQRIQRVCDKSANTPQSLYWKTVLYHSYDLLDSVNDLLTPRMFLLVIKGLLMHSLHTVKKRALELLNNKLQNSQEELKEPEQVELFVLIKPILLIIEMIEQDNLQSDQEVLIQTALLSLKLIVKTLGPQEPEKFVQILEFVESILNSGKAKDNVLASVILCLAELCSVLRAHAISGLASFMPAFLNVLKSQKYQETSSMLLLSVITTVNKLLDSFAAFLSPYLKKLVCETSILISKWSGSGDDPKSHALVARLNGIKKKLSVVIPPRILIPTIEECYDTLISKRYFNALVALIDILEEQLGHLQIVDINPNMSELTSFFLKALQFRSDHSSEEANLVEEQVVKTLTVFVLKLSESSFRPFYLKLYDWAVRSTGSNKERLITFYHLSQGLGQALKGLFVLFASNILNNLAEIVRTVEPSGDKVQTITLLEYALKTLQAICTHDNKKLINRDRFELLMQPLVDLLEKDLDGIEALTRRNEELITPTIVQFCVAVADDSLWKEMNYQILLKMRNSNADIRLAALHCLAEVVSKLRDDFLPLLPETIPFLAELLEDEDERVERACQKAIREMEKVLGEPLQKYF